MNNDCLETVETNVEHLYENPKSCWYKKPLAFWGITLTLSITISVLCAVFIIPNFFRCNYHTKDIFDYIILFFNRIAPYIIGGSGIIFGLKYNIKHKDYSFTVKHYLCSILFTCIGLLISSLILSFFFIIVFLIIIVLLLMSALSALTAGGITYRK